VGKSERIEGGDCSARKPYFPKFSIQWEKTTQGEVGGQIEERQKKKKDQLASPVVAVEKMNDWSEEENQ